VTETVENHQPLEIGLIGHEGLLGATLALGNCCAATQSIVQGSGAALRIEASQLRLELSDSPILLRTLQQYLYVLLTQLSQSTVCLHFHRIQPRLGRWLLMMHDRAHADHFHVTQECVSNMLGVRRSGITVAAGALQKMNLIHYSRGEIQILDRKGLEDVSCECYASMVRSYARQLGQA
jgi:CRP-like cAMP-binding protein